MNNDVLILLFGFLVLFLISIFVTRSIFRIDTIADNLKYQSEIIQQVLINSKHQSAELMTIRKLLSSKLKGEVVNEELIESTMEEVKSVVYK